MAHPLVQAVQRVCQHHLPPNSRVGIAVSGGVDSVVLLHICATLHPLVPFKLCVGIHINHRLRAGYWHAKEVNLIKHYARSLNFEVVIRSIPRGFIATTAKAHGIEARARTLRYAQFCRVAHAYNLDAVFLAHHINDNAETVLMRLLQGNSIMGLGGIPVHRTARWHSHEFCYLRPLHQFSKTQLIEYANSHSLRWIEDSSNRSTHYQRNIIRNNIVPSIRPHFPQYAHSLNDFARQWQKVTAYLSAQANAQLKWHAPHAYARAIEVADIKKAPQIIQYFSIYTTINHLLPYRTIPARFIRYICTAINASTLSNAPIAAGHGLKVLLAEGLLIFTTLSAPPSYYRATIPYNRTCHSKVAVIITSASMLALAHQSPQVAAWIVCAPLNSPLCIYGNFFLHPKLKNIGPTTCIIPSYKCIIADSMGVVVTLGVAQVQQGWQVVNIEASERVLQWGEMRSASNIPPATIVKYQLPTHKVSVRAD